MAETEITSPGQATESVVRAVRLGSVSRAWIIRRRGFMLARAEPALPTPADLDDLKAARAALMSPEPREDYEAVRRELGLDKEE